MSGIAIFCAKVDFFLLRYYAKKRNDLICLQTKTSVAARRRATRCFHGSMSFERQSSAETIERETTERRTLLSAEVKCPALYCLCAQMS